MAGSVTSTITSIGRGTGVLDVVLTWTSDAAGNVNGEVIPLPAGTIVGVNFIPGTGSSQPSALYSVDLLDIAGFSFFDDGTGASIGATLSNTVATRKVPFVNGASTTYVRAFIAGDPNYQLTVSGAGNTKSGTVELFISIQPL
jgi:hypothetical protein